MNNISKYRFRAFISYSSRDRLIGEKFQRALERYKIPRLLHGRETAAGTVPERVQPIFRDRSDLEASDDLGGRITAALEASEWLVVLCSPFSAQSKWVNKEIAQFKRLGRTGQIIAVMVDGRPCEHDQTMQPDGAFPPTLMSTITNDGTLGKPVTVEPFAPDLRDIEEDGSGGDGFENAILKVIAKIIDIPLGELTQRQREVEKRERRIVLGVAATLAVLSTAAIAAATIAWQQTRTANDRLASSIQTAARQLETASTYRERYGVPSGVIEEILEIADKDFSKLRLEAGENPQLVLAEARLALGFASLREVVGKPEEREKDLQDASEALAKLNARSVSAGNIFGLSSSVDRLDLLRETLRLNDEIVTDAVRDENLERVEGVFAESFGLIEKARKSPLRESDIEQQFVLTKRRSADAYYRLAMIEKAKSDYEQAIALLEKRMGKDDDRSERKTLVSAYSGIAAAIMNLELRNEAREYHQKAAKLAGSLWENSQQDNDARRTFAIALLGLGDAIISVKSRPDEEAVQNYEEAEKHIQALIDSDPTRADWQRDLYIIKERLASTYLQLENLDQAKAVNDQAVEIIDKLVKRDEENLDLVRDLSVAYERKGQVQQALAQSARDKARATDHISQAVVALGESVRLRRQRLKADPDGVKTRHDLIIALILYADALTRTENRVEEGFAASDAALSQLRELVKLKDQNSPWHREIVVILAQRASAKIRLKRYEEARSDLTTALSKLRSFRGNYPNTILFKNDESDLTRMLEQIRKFQK